MPLTSDTLRIGEARRIALHAQGFNDPRPTGRVDRRHFRRVMDRLGLVQIDSVNVLTRSHELPFLARLGPYDRAALASWLWGSGEVFEYWDHEASLVPVERHPLLRWRMDGDHAWGGMLNTATKHPELLDQLLGRRARARPRDARRARPPRRRHQAGQGRAREHVELERWPRRAIEWLFWRGEVSAVRNPSTFDAALRPARAGGPGRRSWRRPPPPTTTP